MFCLKKFWLECNLLYTVFWHDCRNNLFFNELGFSTVWFETSHGSPLKVKIAFRPYTSILLKNHCFSAHTFLTFSVSVVYRGRDRLRAITLSADPPSKAQGWPGPHASCHIPVLTCQSPCQGPESLWPFFVAMLFHRALLSETQCVRQQRKIKETHRHKSSPFTHTLLICYCKLRRPTNMNKR